MIIYISSRYVFITELTRLTKQGKTHWF